MSPTLTALVALQSVDSAIDAARRRSAEVPALEQALEEQIAAAEAVVAVGKHRLTESQTTRRALEKDVAAVDARMAKFDDHKAAVKTNHEYTALLHEIATAKTGKDAIEERILIAMEEADGHARDVKAAEAALAALRVDATRRRAELAAELGRLDEELARLQHDRTREAKDVEPRALATYEQLLKGRRGVAVAQLIKGHCGACHVSVRPHFEQQLKRNDAILQCEGCQRILYFVATDQATQHA
jgi:predicted  nucleic acid-binding Zn-ribbon protein